MTFEEMMEQLRAEYVESLPAKIEQINDNLAEQRLAELRDDFHKLKGTGRTYGIPEISELGEVMEKLCLNQPTALSAVPAAIEVLQSIHSERSACREYSLVADTRFARLKGLLAA